MQKQSPLVSIIVPIFKSPANAKLLPECLESLKKQTYKNIEIVVVDNIAKRAGPQVIKIAKKYTKTIFAYGPERNAQRNFGAKASKGDYVYIIDSDFVLEKQVVEQCVKEIEKGADAVVVHNTPDENISWVARIRKFEVDMYKYSLEHSAARFFKRSVFVTVGGYNEKITSGGGDDYDLQNKVNRRGYKTAFIKAEAIHRGEPTSFWTHMKKYFDYGQDFVNFVSDNKKESVGQLNMVRGEYLKNWRKFIRQPVIGVAFIFYTFVKYAFGAAGYAVGLVNTRFSRVAHASKTAD